LFLVDCLICGQLRAISVLQRDLQREEKRIEEEQAAKAAAEERVASPDRMIEDESQKAFPPTQNSSPMSSTHTGRRPSAISISSLHRPSFPLKLDLSAVSFRMPTEDNAIIPSGLASPVTLVPKSARPMGTNELPSDFMTAFGGSDTNSRQGDIDLTLSDNIHSSNEAVSGGPVDLTAGGSADKPIELDLDLFGDDVESGTGDIDSDTLLYPTMVEEGAAEVKASDFFKHLEDNAIFPGLGSNSSGEPSGSKIANAVQELSVPSPGSMLATFPSPSNPPDMGMGEQTFDFNAIDLTNLDSTFFSGAEGQPVDFSSVDFTMGESSEPPRGASGDDQGS